MKRTKSNSENSEWRIKSIPFQDEYKMMKTNWGALFGALLFIFGIFAGFKEKELFLISLIGLVLMLLSVLQRGRNVRRGWKKITTKCIDKETKRTLGKPGSNGGIRYVWTFQLLCEFEMGGKPYTVTPKHWTTFTSESSLQKFLNKVISSDGTCQLWVNPKNPLQTEIFANDIKDFFMH